MRRVEDDVLAISPPPEFQDLGPPSTSSLVVPLPPPVDFRDLSPSPNCGEPILTFGSNPHTILPIQSFHHGRTFVRKGVWDFAERISFSIVSEAMVIAAIIPEAGSITVTDFRIGSTSTTGTFIADSSERNVLSAPTSWEYLPRTPRLTCVTSRQETVLPAKLTGEGMGVTVLNADSVRVLILQNDANSSSGHAKDSLTKPCPNREGKGRKSLDDVKTRSRNTVEVEDTVLARCDKAFIECDIYSLPLDNIPQGCTDPSALINDHTSRQRYTKFDKSKNQQQRHSIHFGESTERLEPHPCSSITTANSLLPSSNRGLKIRNSQRQQRGPLELKILNEEDRRHAQAAAIRSRLERNNNNEDELAVHNHKELRQCRKLSGQRSKKRRGESVTDKIENTHPQEQCERNDESSQRVLVHDQDHFKEDTSHGSPGKEKRNFGHTFMNLFRRSRPKDKALESSNRNEIGFQDDSSNVSRALPAPPLILEEAEDDDVEEKVETPASLESLIQPRDVADSLEKVKDCGWYWGPLSSEGAEDLLRGEPDGSFIVRDSSDARYIFSLTFKLNGLIRHVRIEHDQGNFSFGPLTRFKASTIVDFVEKAVAHSRSGRYLFFLHRRPILGPMRVQLLHPYSRFRHPRSLQHMCRFVILKTVRRDLINHLILPKPILEYLNAPQYYFEEQGH